MFALALALISTAHADEPAPKRFSFGFGLGIRPDMASLGSTIVQDGTVDTADTTLANAVYSTDKALMSDRNNMTLAANSRKTDSVFNVLDDYTAGGSLLGLEFGLDGRYELDVDTGLPLFIETGFYYTRRISGGRQSRTLGDIATQSEDLVTLFCFNWLDAEEYVCGTMVTQWDASWIEVPISVGVKAKTSRPNTFAYGSVGVSVFSGGFDIGIDVDEKYANVVNTHLIESDGLIPFDVVDLSPDGGVQDTIRFRATAVGLNYGVGAQAGIGQRVAVFVELNQSGAAKTVFAEPLGAKTKQLLTAASSATLAESDPDWVQDIGYPVVMTGGAGRVGIRAYLF